MIDFGKVVYLDVEKTGGSFVASVLGDIVPHETQVYNKHDRLRRKPEPDDVLLTSVRNPVSQWVSLYQFGTATRGPVRKALDKAGAGRFNYDGSLDDFLLWVDFCLDPANAAVFPRNYAKACPELIGLQTFRFLRLNLAVQPNRLGNAKTKDDVRKLLAKHSLKAHVLRTENLSADLAEACRTIMANVLPDPEAAVEAFMSLPKRNASKKQTFGSGDLPADVVKKIWEREWLLKELFYPDADKG